MWGFENLKMGRINVRIINVRMILNYQIVKSINHHQIFKLSNLQINRQIKTRIFALLINYHRDVRELAGDGDNYH